MAGVLNGIHVVSLAVNLPGPLAAGRLATLGATVTKVESPAGDPLAAAAPGWYAQLTGGQQVVELDLKTRAGQDRLEELLADADLLLTSHRPSALRRLGLANLAGGANPRLSHVEIVGHEGGREEMPGHDLNYQAASGTLDPPRMPLVPVTDLLGAERAVSAALAAILECGRSGRGTHHRVALETAAADAGSSVRHGLTGPGTPLGGALPTYGIYPSADGHVALGALEPDLRGLALHVLGTADDHAKIAAVLARKPNRHWESLAAAHGIPLTAVFTPPREP